MAERGARALGPWRRSRVAAGFSGIAIAGVLALHVRAATWPQDRPAFEPANVAPPSTPAGGASDAVRAEWRVRTWALDLDGTRDAWRAAAASTDWTERYRALDAIARAAAGGALAARPDAGGDDVRSIALELARRALADPQPNLAALAARVLVAADAADLPTLARVVDLADSPLAETRAAAARLLAARSEDALQRVRHLEHLAGDGDPSVAEEARRGLVRVLLFAHARSSDDVRAATDRAALAFVRELALVHARSGEDAAVDLLAPLADAAPFAAERLAAAADDAAASAPDASEELRVAALVRVASAAAGQPLDPTVLVDTWCTSASWSTDRDALFTRAARRIGATAVSELVEGAELAHVAFERPQRDAELGSGVRARGLRALVDDPTARRYPLASVLLRAAHAAGGTAALLERLERAGDGLLVHALDVLAPSLVGWEPEDVAALAPRADRCGARRDLEQVWILAARQGDAVARAALVARLEETIEHDGARGHALVLFRALARLPDPRPVFDDLRRVFLERAAHGPLEYAQLLPSEAHDARVRDLLLARGQREPDERGSIAWALRGATGDADVTFQLERWLVELMAAFESPDPADARRALDVASQLVPALASAGGADAVEALELAFEWSVGREPELGRLAARALGRTQPGRARLVERLGTPLGRELESEVVFALTEGGGADVPRDELAAYADRLVEALDGFAGDETSDERFRRFDAYARLDTPAAIDALLRAVAEVERGAEHALSALARTSVDPRRLDALARDVRDFDLRRAALRALERRGARDVLDAFFADWSELARGTHAVDQVTWGDGDWARRELGLDLALPGHPEELAAVRNQVRAALARLGAPVQQWREAVLAAAIRDAPAALERRFDGRGAPDPAFRYWLELELARVLAERADLGAALAGNPRWTRIDGELLLEFASIAAAAGDPATVELARAAIVALEPFARRVGSEPLRARALVAAALWRAEDPAAALAPFRHLGDPFAARSQGRSDTAARPVPGAQPASRRALWRSGLWSDALAAAQRGAAERAWDRLWRAACTLDLDPEARAQHAAVEARVEERVGPPR